jgi:lipoate-protein ligase A
MLDRVHDFVMGRTQTAIGNAGLDVRFQGTCDLTYTNCKFSGNSLRCKRNCLLYHGTILYDFPLPLIGKCLAHPPRQPDYRGGRDHDAFVANLPLPDATLRDKLLDVWLGPADDGSAKSISVEPDRRDLAMIETLIHGKYATKAWTWKLP